MDVIDPFGGGSVGGGGGGSLAGDSGASTAPATNDLGSVPTFTNPTTAGGGSVADPFGGPPGPQTTTDPAVTTPASSGGSPLSEALKAINVPLRLLGGLGQVSLHTIQAGKDIVTGQGAGAAVHQLAQGGLNLISLGQSGEKTNFQNAIGTHVGGLGGAVLNAVGGFATDPLTYLTLGMGGLADSGVHALEAAGESGDIVDAVKSGTALTAEQSNRARSILQDAATAGGKSPEEAATIADSKLSAMAQRGQGGVGLHIPGTDVGAHIAGSFDTPDWAKNIFSNASASTNKVLSGIAEGANDSKFAEEGARVGANMAHQGANIANDGLLTRVNNAWANMFRGTPGNAVRGAVRSLFQSIGNGLNPAEVVKGGMEGRALKDALGTAIKESGGDTESLLSGVKSATRASAKSGLQDISHSDFQQLMDDGLREQGSSLPQVKAALIDKVGADNADRALAAYEGMAKMGKNWFQTPMQQQSLLAAMSDIGDKFPTDQIPQQVKDLASSAAEAGRKVTGAVANPIRHLSQGIKEDTMMANFLHSYDRLGDVSEAADHTSAIFNQGKGLFGTMRPKSQVSVIAPFWDAIKEGSKALGAQMFENPYRFALLNDALQHTPVETSTANPMATAARIPGIFTSLFTKDHAAGMKALGDEFGGPIANLIRLGVQPPGGSPAKASFKGATELIPGLGIAPLPGKKANLAEQAQKAFTGFQFTGKQ